MVMMVIMMMMVVVIFIANLPQSTLLLLCIQFVLYLRLIDEEKVLCNVFIIYNIYNKKPGYLSTRYLHKANPDLALLV